MYLKKLALLLLLISFVSATECYQESANISDQSGTDGSCALVYNGTYQSSISLVNSVDGNWNSAFDDLLSNGYIVANYTVPLAGISAKWSVRDQTSNTTGYLNFSLPSDCFSSELSLNITSSPDGRDVNYYCYNYTSGSYLLLLASTSNPLIFEEGVYWNIDDEISSCTSLSDSMQYFLTSNISTTGAHCITIAANDVSLDCQGYSISTDSSYDGVLNGIYNNTLIKNCIITSSRASISTYAGQNITILNNTLSGAANSCVFIQSGNNVIANNTVHNCGNESYESGIELDGDPQNNLIENNTVYSNYFSGIRVTGGGTNVTNNTVYSNQEAISIIDSGLNTLLNLNTAYNNTIGGLVACCGSVNTTMTSNDVYNNTVGIYASTYSTIENLTISSNEIYNNTDGIYLLDAHLVTGSVNHLYDNDDQDVHVKATSGFKTITLDNLIFDSDAGTYANYTNFSIVDIVGTEEYDIKYATLPGALPAEYRSFGNKYLEFNSITGAPILGTATWHWLDSELTGNIDESAFQIHSYNSTAWNSRATSPTTSENLIQYSSVSVLETYGLLESVVPYFASPTPTNGSAVSSTSVIINLTSTISFDPPCYIEIEGTNYSGTITGSSCLYTLSPGSHANVYDMKGFMNRSGTFIASANRSFTWYDEDQCPVIDTVYSINQNSTVYAKPGDSYLYVLANLSLNNTCPISLSDFQYDINDSTANSYTTYLIDLESSVTNNFTNYPFRIPITFTDEGEKGGYAFFTKESNRLYILNTSYSRQVSAARVNLTALGDFRDLFVCSNTTDCLLQQSLWTGPVSTTTSSGRILRIGDILYAGDVLGFIISYETQESVSPGGGGGGGGIPVYYDDKLNELEEIINQNETPEETIEQKLPAIQQFASDIDAFFRALTKIPLLNFRLSTAGISVLFLVLAFAIRRKDLGGELESLDAVLIILAIAIGLPYREILLAGIF